MLKFRAAAVAVLFAAALPGCKIIKTPTPEEKAAAAAVGAFDPARAVDKIWQGQVLPHLDTRGGPLAEVVKAAASAPDQAGATYGNPKKQASAPWTYAVKFTGTIVAADTASRAGTLDVDTDGDGKADAKVQIGPAIRGTAIRDALDFVNFNDFKNQIEWAQFGKAFNARINEAVVKDLPRDGLTGKSLTVTGAFPLAKAGELPLVTPVALTLGAAP